MNDNERIEQLAKFLVDRVEDVSESEAREIAQEAIAQGEPLLETICFQILAENILARIHDASWITSRGRQSESEDADLIQRLLDAGAMPEDLALFARMSQREYLSNLGCILDGAGIHGTPNLPHQSFRVFSVDDKDNPIAMIEDLHESMGFSDLETEMKQSRNAEDEVDKS